MSGVNAHAIFSAASSTSDDRLARQRAPMRRQRFWAVPQPHKMAGRFGGVGGRSVFVQDVRAAELAFLADHQVC